MEIQNLLNEYPATMKLENLKPFWSGYKKKPTPLELTHSDELALKFIFSTAKILAHILKISSPDSLKDITTLLKMGLEVMLVIEISKTLTIIYRAKTRFQRKKFSMKQQVIR